MTLKIYWEIFPAGRTGEISLTILLNVFLWAKIKTSQFSTAICNFINDILIIAYLSCFLRLNIYFVSD